MKRIYLEKITQNNITFYVGKADPRDLVKMATKIEIGETQEAQRPLSGKRVKEIAKYVDEGEGMLATSVVLATNDDKLTINETKVTTEDADSFVLYYIEIPTTPSEFDDYKNTIDVMDGQHRLYSFADDYRTLKDEVPYEVNISLFSVPTMRERRLIFKNTNEKQEKVSSNLLMWFRKQLGMLDGKEKLYYDLVSKLNSENSSPLKGRIIMSAEKKTNGIKAQQLINVLDKAKIDNLQNSKGKLSEDQKFKLICIYLKAWEKVCDIDFSNPNSAVDGASTKISGLRFLLLLLPTFWDRSKMTRKPFDENFVQTVANQFLSEAGLEGVELFTSEDTKLVFRGETATIEFAEQCKQTITGLGADDFDPLS